MDVHGATEVVDQMIIDACAVGGKIASIPNAERLNGGTAVGIRIQVLRDVKTELTRAAILELENEGARG